MIEFSKRMGIIASIVEEMQSLGKTAMMKFIFILQQVYKVPLGYDYDIYTYGPYSSGVMEDIQLAYDYRAIAMDTVVFSSGHKGYELKPTSETEGIIKREQEFVDLYKGYVSQVIHLFGNRSARDLELSSTIIYIYCNYAHNKWDNSLTEVSLNVKKIKPHFDMDAIQEEYQRLENLGVLRMSV